MRTCILFVCLLSLWGCATFSQQDSGPQPGAEVTKAKAQDSVDRHGNSEAAMEESARADGSAEAAPVSPLEDSGPVSLLDESTPDVEDLTPLTPEEEEALQTRVGIVFDLDIRETEEMQTYFHYYTHKHRQTFAKWLKRSEPYLPYIRQVFRERGLPEDLIFLPFAESGFNPWAYSWAGAGGLWQFMPATGRMYGLRVDWWVDERRDPYKATVAAADYLQKLYADFGDWYLALAAYNAGEGRVARALKKSGCNDFFDMISSRKYLKAETRQYVPKFLAILKILQNLEELGFDPLDLSRDPEVLPLEVRGGTDLLALSRACNMQWKEFSRLNPAFRRQVAPPDLKTTVYVPEDKMQSAGAYVENPASTPYAGFRRYQIRSGDSWWKIARRNNVPLQVLKQVNNRSGNLIRPGQWIMIPGQSGLPVASSHGSVQNFADSNGNYVVRAGDNLWDIARKFGTTVDAIVKNNGLRNARSLSIGQKLYIASASPKTKTREIARSRANYVVHAGDNLWDISRRFGTSVETIVRANGLRNARSLSIGQKLYIPDPGSGRSASAALDSRPAKESMVHYLVRRGDTLWDISRQFGVSTSDLQAWNNLGRSSRLMPGDKLKIFVR